MIIAHLLPATAKFPLLNHNGRYEWVMRLANIQVAAGHAVVIYCGGGMSGNPAVELRMLEQSSASSTSATKLQNNTLLIQQAFSNDSIDVFHSHFDSLGAQLAHNTTKPVITTQHWFPSENIAEAFASSPANAITVPVTDYMHEIDISLGICPTRTIHHGIDLSLFHPGTTRRKNGRYLYVGRVTPGKGVKEAVNIARNAGVALDIVGKLNESDMPYYASFKDLIDGSSIVFHGSKPQEIVSLMMQSAQGFLFPNIRPEAFGQTIVEAQASGCPVIVSDCGANAELVKEGISGFVCRSKEDYEAAINLVRKLSADDCRAFAEHFNINKMASQYESLYERSIYSS